MRKHQRQPDQMRPILIETDFQKGPAGSVLISCGDTRVCCAAHVETKVPPWFARDRAGGWITAEYAMLPGATLTRSSRTRKGREEEIQRLIGRSLRAAVNLEALPPCTITLDCDVLQADAGTRCASITGAFVALTLALAHLQKKNLLRTLPLRHAVCACSCVLFQGDALLDPDYAEDSSAEVDMNFVFTQALDLVEIQGTAEGHPFSTGQLSTLLDLARQGAEVNFEAQRQALGQLFPQL
ncbi:ribonuclease PH [Myxococcota bacterium]|jgi:ribonuclease PH|nr:ribonuclease PH [Myxococcota bacterium]MBU1410817.1 ribonuclease PH [Myxococcota bacterium]MBU1510661.1 ribonuclease PH [Myxococcota bacterium]PKN24079.1 MAG: ribonuclease PH [Deltaproteobacteria bacterium HGW-Deltaproteobacteria-22]